MSKINQYFLETMIKLTLIHRADVVDYTFRHFQNDLYDKSLNLIGINNVGDSHISGEYHVIKDILANRLPPQATIFEVGANTGQDTVELEHIFPQAELYSFEPNKHAFAKLQKVARNRTRLYSMALGAKPGYLTHYSYKDVQHTQLATSSKTVLTDMFIVKDKLEAYKVRATTLDDFTRLHKIKHIHFLKIDVEGAERDVLLGARRMLKNKAIDYIQFEFNVHNVVNRIFLRDFYELLHGYTFYRILPDGLLPLGEYHPRHEIFQYQNIFAVKDGV